MQLGSNVLLIQFVLTLTGNEEYFSLYYTWKKEA